MLLVSNGGHQVIDAFRILIEGVPMLINTSGGRNPKTEPGALFTEIIYLGKRGFREMLILLRPMNLIEFDPLGSHGSPRT